MWVLLGGSWEVGAMGAMGRMLEGGRDDWP